jgi:hypothetical protein
MIADGGVLFKAVCAGKPRESWIETRGRYAPREGIKKELTGIKRGIRM